MPNITFDGPPIKDLDKKRALVAEVTDAAVKAYGFPKQAFVIILKENAPENVGIGGQLLIDRH
jgi:4-oxalocrotonate tautomerase